MVTKSLSPTEPPRMPTGLLAHQRHAYRELHRVASTFFEGGWQGAPIRPRSNLLITGPTGLGKTEVTRILARELDVPFIETGFSDWLPMGASNRGSIHTWPMLLRFIHQNDQGIIFIDEVDKATGTGDWAMYIRLELFSLLDHRIPPNIEIEDIDADQDGDLKRQKYLAAAQQKLPNSFLVIGAGAFQELNEARTAGAIGFGPRTDGGALNLEELAHVLPRELTNRFRAQLIQLPSLQRGCYLDMLETTAQRFTDSRLAATYLSIGRQTVDQAVANQQGIRWLEEILLDAVSNTRTMPAPAPNAPATERATIPETGLDW